VKIDCKIKLKYNLNLVPKITFISEKEFIEVFKLSIFRFSDNITKYLFELLNGNKWEPITVYYAYRLLVQLVIEGAKELCKDIKLKNSNKYKLLEFLIDDYQNN
jgi:hypothetical protein